MLNLEEFTKKAKIIKREKLAGSENGFVMGDIWRYIIKYPPVARSIKAGQFVILMNNENQKEGVCLSEGIPLTMNDRNIEDGTVTIVFQIVGDGTLGLGYMKVGDEFPSFRGPLGNASEIDRVENYVVGIAGGVGAAPIMPIMQANKLAGNKTITILGARNKDLLILEKELKNSKISDELIVCTDNGSYGRKGFVTDALKDLIEKGVKIDKVIAIGPGVMMEAVCKITEIHNIPTIVSLNTIMIDGTGMCGGCRVRIKNKKTGEYESLFGCQDGPEFDGHLIDWENFNNRLTPYCKQEKEALARRKDILV